MNATLPLAAVPVTAAPHARTTRSPAPRSALRSASSWAGALLLLAGLAGCGGAPVAPRAAPEIPASVTASGQTVYFGSVFPLKSPAKDPTFVYERRVGERDGALVSTHITREPSGAIARAESAIHSADYALTEYTLHASQLGQTGSIRVDHNRVSFRLADGAEERSRVEQQTGAVVVGPTLVGYIVKHLDVLRAGEVLAVRLAVLDRMETIGFELQAEPSQPGQTRVKMKASSFVFGLFIDPVHFTFNAATGKLVRLEGRVPPKVRTGDTWSDFDARVDYRFVADTYR